MKPDTTTKGPIILTRAQSDDDKIDKAITNRAAAVALWATRTEKI